MRILGGRITFCTLGLIFLAVSASAAVLYVDLNSTNATPPYSDWSIAATNIQDAIDAAISQDVVLVTNGVYQTGQRIDENGSANRITITKPILVKSVNGPSVTIITAGGGTRCAYLTNGAALVGFSLSRGSVFSANGGGVYCKSTSAFLTNCIITNCFATSGGGVYSGTLYDSTIINNMINGPGYGAGAYVSTVYNCTFIGNSNAWYGGGAANCLLDHCVLTNNYGGSGGGAYACGLVDCLVINNSSPRPQYYGINSGGGVSGGALTNCTLIGNSAIYGGGACGGLITIGSYTYATNPIILNHCVISNNTAAFGGGVYETNGLNVTNCILINCAVTGNTATNMGGGVFGGVLDQCVVNGNRVTSATGRGGGLVGSLLNNSAVLGNIAAAGSGLDRSIPYYFPGVTTLTNCTIAGNIATNGAAVTSENRLISLYNCIIYDNVVYINGTAIQSNYNGATSMSHTCTIPLPTGVGNFTNNPAFLNSAANDYHLQSNSPCINAGSNYAITTGDLDGNPRISGGTVDMGCYEYQTPASVLSYIWAQRYGLATDGSADFIDSDGDGLNNWQEWIAGTNPTNAASVLKLTSPSNSIAGVTVTWQSVMNVTYYLQSSTNLAAQPAFISIQSNLVGQASSTSYTDTTATNGGSYFYRVGVQ